RHHQLARRGRAEGGACRSLAQSPHRTDLARSLRARNDGGDRRDDRRAAVRQDLGYDGAGVGVALIDSGIASWHEDLSGENGLRVSEFVDFVNGMEAPYDDYGHGTHVAGIVAGNGYDSDGARAGIAPA